MAIETLGAALRQINRLFAEGVVTGLSDAQLFEHFLNQRDAGAFEALVARHGPMVLSVCRGILRDPHDAEDAFQATFLVLVKKGGTIRGRDALGGWLHQVAHRVAIQANVAAARRRRHERQVGQMAVATSTNGPAASDDLLLALHEEIARLPEKYRLAVVYCDLDCMTQAQAAGQLHWSERTIHHRLAEGRARLKRRLARRGLAPDGATLGAVFLGEARAAVPAAWSEMTVRAALAAVNHTMTVGVVSAGAKELTQEVLRIMLLKKVTLASATLLAAGLIVWGASVALVSLGGEPAKETAAAPDPPAQRTAKTAVPQPEPDSLDTLGKVTIRGRVLGPDGQPVPDAKIYRTPAIWGLRLPYPSPVYATSGPDGGFQFLADKREVLARGNEKYFFETTIVAAAAAKYGVAWAEIPTVGRIDDLTLHLANDEPITGQIVDLQGTPVAGATLQVLQIQAAAGEDLGPWLEAAKTRKEESGTLEWQYLPRATIAPAPKVTTDDKGRFRLAGIGRNRLVVARLDGPTIVSQDLHILTRPGESIEVLQFQAPRRVVTTYYGASFRHAAAPTKPIVGVIRDKDTKKPLAGITIRSSRLANSPSRPDRFDDIDMVQTKTDTEGRYRLTGMPKGDGNKITAVPGSDQPYLIFRKDAPDSPGFDPVTVDIELKRGVWIEGKITDKITGKPLHQNVSYFAQPDNPNLDDYVADRIIYTRAATNEDGSYRLAGMPGPGLVAVDFMLDYLRAPERDDEFAVKEVFIPTVALIMVNYSAIARIDSPTGVESVKRNVTLDPGWTFTGTVLGPDGQPLDGAWGIGLTTRPFGWDRREVMKTAEFTVSGFNPRQPRDLLVQHPKTGLVGVARPPKTKGDSITVQLQPGATVTGRLVDTDGQARSGVELSFYRHKEGLARPDEMAYFPPQRITTDQQGRFRIGALLPGYKFALSDGKGSLVFGDGLRSSQTKNLGDVKIGDE
jgi:RNA polymerase sigma factor (sigma-70 family)